MEANVSPNQPLDFDRFLSDAMEQAERQAALGELFIHQHHRLDEAIEQTGFEAFVAGSPAYELYRQQLTTQYHAQLFMGEDYTPMSIGEELKVYIEAHVQISMSERIEREKHIITSAMTIAALNELMAVMGSTQNSVVLQRDAKRRLIAELVVKDGYQISDPLPRLLNEYIPGEPVSLDDPEVSGIVLEALEAMTNPDSLTSEVEELHRFTAELFDELPIEVASISNGEFTRFLHAITSMIYVANLSRRDTSINRSAKLEERLYDISRENILPFNVEQLMIARITTFFSNPFNSAGD